MAWITATLDDIFPSQFAAASSMVAGAQATLTDLNPKESQAQAALLAAQSMVAEANGLLDDLGASGIYQLALLPQAGSWSSRAFAAAGAPANDGALYTAVFANIFVAPTLGQAESGYDSMKSALMSAIVTPDPDKPEIGFVTPEPEGEPAWGSENAWESATVAKVSPAALVSAKDALNEANKALAKAQAVVDGIAAKKAAAQEALDQAQAVVSSLSSTGVYTVMLLPAVGGWYDRMVAESGKPPEDPQQFSAGTITVVQAPDLATVLSRWASIQGVL